jgi:TonB family protein
MALSGHSRELSLVDLVQASMLGRNTCRILVATAEGRGVIYLEDGRVVDAALGNLAGRDAFVAMIAREDVYFHVDTGVRSPTRTVSEDSQVLLLDAMRLHDEGLLPRPDFSSNRADVPSVSNGNIRRFPAMAERPTVEAAPETAAGQPPAGARRWPLVVGGMVVIAVLATTALIMARPAQRPTTTSPPAGSAVDEIVEANALSEPGDVPPRVLSSTAPSSPDRTLAIKPTIVCRILVGTDGTIRDAKIYRSRLDLASFEEAALEHVKTLRFAPGRRAGAPVAVWLNWPVSFQ